jgi:lipid-A-disaccharide synthase
MVAGETSGDLLAGLLLHGLRQRWPDLDSHRASAGPQMAPRAFEAWWPHDKLAVRGYVEVLRHYREIVASATSCASACCWSGPTLFIGVDAPDFNLDLEADLRAQGIPTVHFVCPSIWAWRAERVEKIRRSADHVLCIFPFEPALLARHGIAATYVGTRWPGDPAGARPRCRPPQLGLPMATDTVVAILPGSRRSEVQYLALRFFSGCSGCIQAARPAIKM